MCKVKQCKQKSKATKSPKQAKQTLIATYKSETHVSTLSYNQGGRLGLPPTKEATVSKATLALGAAGDARLIVEEKEEDFPDDQGPRSEKFEEKATNI